MADTVKFLNSPYSAYFHRDVPREDEELTHVGPGTPGGEYLRRFWQPVAMSSELKDLPLAIRIMGEDLVLFRDLGGRVGLLERHCSHRGTSLEFGIVSERGIRCCYHGWLYDVDGRVLEAPGEPSASTLKDRLYHGAYLAFDYKGLVFAYMGPPDKKPDFPIYDTFELPEDRLVPYSLTYPCNWVQTVDNSMDPAHVVFLHTRISFAHFSEAWGEMPEMEFQHTPLGMIYITARRVGNHVWVRSNDLILPNMILVSATWVDGTRENIFTRVSATRWRVPIDNTRTLIIGWRHFDKSVDPNNRGKEEDVGKEKMDAFGQTSDRPYEERQRVPGDYDAQVSQRPVAIHALEHLASTDRGVIMFRKLLRQGIRAVASGKDPEAPTRKGESIPTYSHDTILRIPPRPGKDDRQLLREVAGTVTRIVRESVQCAGEERRAYIEESVRDLTRVLPESAPSSDP